MPRFETICISESYLNSDISSSNDQLNISGYTVSRADYRSGNRCERVCIYC